jgi:hypothetical protein
MRNWISLFIFELFTGALAGFIFQILDRNLAGYIAGSFFFAVGVLAVCFSWSHSVKWRPLNILVSAIYLFGLSGPLFVTRLIMPSNQPVISVMGIPMGDFHSYSVTAYKFLMAMTVLQIIFVRLNKRKSSVVI